MGNVHIFWTNWPTAFVNEKRTLWLVFIGTSWLTDREEKDVIRFGFWGKNGGHDTPLCVGKLSFQPF